MKKEKKIESEKESLTRRISEFRDYAIATRRFSDVAFYDDLSRYINQDHPSDHR